MNWEGREGELQDALDRNRPVSVAAPKFGGVTECEQTEGTHFPNVFG